MPRLSNLDLNFKFLILPGQRLEGVPVLYLEHLWTTAMLNILKRSFCQSVNIVNIIVTKTQ